PAFVSDTALSVPRSALSELALSELEISTLSELATTSSRMIESIALWPLARSRLNSLHVNLPKLGPLKARVFPRLSIVSENDQIRDILPRVSGITQVGSVGSPTRACHSAHKLRMTWTAKNKTLAKPPRGTLVCPEYQYRSTPLICRVRRP